MGTGRARIWIGLAVVAVFAFPASAGAANYVVDDTDDLHDANLGGDNVCDAAGADTCTLRAAVETAQGALSPSADVVELPFDVAISLGEFPASSNGDLEVRGTKLSGERSVIDANDTSRHFALNGVNLTLQGLALVDGRDDPATAASGGSIVFIPTTPGQTLALNDVRLESNDAFASNVNGGASYGGAISVPGGIGPNIEVVDSRIVGNVAGDADDSGEGGAIRVAAQTPTLTITDSILSQNIAKGDNVISRGGALAIEHTSASDPSGTVTITGSSIDGNRVGGDGTTGAGHGGGIYLNGPTGFAPDLSVTGGFIFSNIAGGGSGNAEGDGGAIYNLSGGPEISLTGVTLNSNRVGGNDTLADGSGTGIGGAIHSYAPLAITNSTLNTNRAGISPSGTPEGDGGAIYAAGSGGVTIIGSMFDQNLAGSGQGYGGALVVQTQGPLSITDSALTGNVAGLVGGALLRNRDPVTGGDDVIARSTIAGNQGSLQGGGISMEGKGTMRVEDSTVSGNTSTSTLGSGGGLWASGTGGVKATLRVTRSTVTGNTAGNLTASQSRGGGITVGEGSESADLFVQESTVAGNSALALIQGAGGNIRARGVALASTVSFRDSIIADGIATIAGSESCSITGMATATSLGGNLEDTTPTQCGLGVGDLIGMDPGLLPLADNGGPTMTRALPLNSPALNLIASPCPGGAQDQRGVTRPQGPGCDTGAFELEYHTLTVTIAGSGTGAVTGTGINCPGDCTESYPQGTDVTLNAAPSGTSLFSGWSGACSGTGSCPLTLNTNKSVAAGFALPTPPAAVTVKCKKGFKKVRKKGKIRCKRKKRKKR